MTPHLENTNSAEVSQDSTTALHTEDYITVIESYAYRFRLDKDIRLWWCSCSSSSPGGCGSNDASVDALMECLPQHPWEVLLMGSTALPQTFPGFT